MPSIGGITVLTMTGSPVPSGRGVEQFNRPGEDYSQRRQVGLREKTAVLETLLISSSADADIAVQVGLQGQVYDIIDDHGTTFVDCLILDVQPEKRAVIHNGSPVVLIRTRWTVQWEA